MNIKYLQSPDQDHKYVVLKNSEHILKGPLFSELKVKEHAVPPCLVLVIDDNLYGLIVSLSYI